MKANLEGFIRKFKEVDKGDIPDFGKCVRPLDIALWVLCVAKDKVDQKRLTAEQIALVIVETQEISANTSSIQNALNRASDKVHRHYENDKTYFELMRPGREYLLSLSKKDLINAFYFEPDNKYTAKKLLRNEIFKNLEGDLKIVDPYFGERTLDILESIKDRPMKILTKLENLREREGKRFMRELTDFKTENPNVEFRNYPHCDIHDRYIISEDKVVLIGHSIKDIGAKESFAVILDRKNYSDIYEALSGNFNNRWNISATI